MPKTENIRVFKVESKRQMADILTKGSPKSTFENIWEIINGMVIKLALEREC